MTNLDVVIVNWNSGNQLRDCLQSLQAAYHHSVFHLSRCIVVDNASTDGSLDGVENSRLPVTLVKNQENKGFGCASNQGAKIGQAEYILFLNPDVRLFPDNLMKALSFLVEPQNEKIGILGIQLITAGGAIERNTARFPTPTSFFYQMLGLDRLWPKRFPPLIMIDWGHNENRSLDHVSGAFFLVRRRFFEELKGFDERFFMYYEDLDFSVRSKQAGWTSYYLSETQAFHQGGGTSSQIKDRRLFYVLRSRPYYIAKHFGFGTALGAIIFSVTVEFWVRLGRAIINFPKDNPITVVRAYWMFIKMLPQLVKKLQGKS